MVLVGGLCLGSYALARAIHHPAATPQTRVARPMDRSASASKSASTVKPAENAVTISAVGDMELGNTPNLPADPSTYLQTLESALTAPIVFGNLEGTLTDASASKCTADATNCYAFRTPPTFAQIFRQNGFTVLNSANNHSHDYGQLGVSDTSAALQASGITQAGLPGQIGLVTDGSTKVAFVDFAPYTDVNNLLDFSTAKRLISQARSHANVVVVYMHAGAEGSNAGHVTGNEETFDGEDRGNAEVFAHDAIDDGAALVIASGPHVLRGLQFYHGHLIDYSLGDFANYNNFSTVGDLDLSGILTVTLRADGTYLGAHFTSLLLTAKGQPMIDASQASATFVNRLSSADFTGTAAIIQPDTLINPPQTADQHP
jgi:poly-gamma-glutamate capsule biosynthesis protein CapA/YwtB (metallophosphatase superfamily)